MSGYYDIIGDIHGYGDALEGLLTTLDYRRTGAVWRHPTRTAVFVGDLIDRGPHQRRVVDTVRAMVEDGAAYCILGNHEYNALAWATERADGRGHLREHHDRHHRQHRAFLDAYAGDAQAYRQALAWFMRLPLWLDLGPLRIVHACWDAATLEALAPALTPKRTLTEHSLHAGADESTATFRHLETVLKGPEMRLPEGVVYHDGEGTRRSRMRVRWWERGPHTLRTAGMVPHAVAQSLPPDRRVDLPVEPYAAEAPPVFFGHYWLSGPPAPLTVNAVCTDYSVAGGGLLAAYRWDGGAVQADGFVAVNQRGVPV